jgi:hypothetical protein
MTLMQALKQPAWWYSKPRFYRADHNRRIHLSRRTLIRRYYTWKRNGKTPSSAMLRYRSGRPKIAAGEVQRFAMACLKPGICSLYQAYAVLKRPGGSVHGLRHGLPKNQLAAILEMLAARRRARFLAKRAEKALGRKAACLISGITNGRDARAFNGGLTGKESVVKRSKLASKGASHG